MTDADGVATPGRSRVLLDVREAAAFLMSTGGHPWTPGAVRGAWAAGLLPGHRRGNTLVFRRTELEGLAATARPPGADGVPPGGRAEAAVRRERVRGLRAGGLTLAAIAAAVGVSAEQVRQDLRPPRPPRPARPRPADRG